jgi:hypothetical protein
MVMGDVKPLEKSGKKCWRVNAILEKIRGE